MKPWFVTEPGSPMGRWPGVMEQDGRIIAFAVPDVTTGMELINLRAQLVAATERAEKAEAVLANIPMASLLRFVEATLMRAQPLQFDVEAVEKWLESPLARV